MSEVRDGYGQEQEDPAVGWKNRVQFADHHGGRSFAYRPEQVLTTRADEALKIARNRYPSAKIRIDGRFGPLGRLVGVPDPLQLIEDLRLAGILARPNHVFFVHCECCAPHPATGCAGGYGYGYSYGFNPASINPASINPASINPASINPASINPASINPASINPNDPRRITGVRRSSARPAAPTQDEAEAVGMRICADVAEGAPKVFVLDTGLAGTGRSDVLEAAHALHGAQIDAPDKDGNDMLDPAAGHGTFIAGVINQVAPGCDITVDQVASIYGDVEELTAAMLITNLEADDKTILSLSFGGGAMDDDAVALSLAIRTFQDKGGLVVASAGNDGSCHPAYPAALPGVISVGALASWGPAPFTNYGPWVRACAPGVDLLSLFFADFKGKLGMGADGVDQDNFEGWAYWSGTSFAAPVVVGALARMMMWARCTAAEAVARVIDAPALLRIPNLGTVVNVI